MKWIRTVWRDSVGSKVIATCIVSVAALMIHSYWAAIWNWLSAPLTISPLQIVFSMCVLGALAMLAVRTINGRPRTPGSGHWDASRTELMEVRGKEFVGQRVEICGYAYYGCTFRACAMVYTGRGSTRLENNRFVGCTWAIDGPAAQTMAFFRVLYHSEEAGRNLVEATFEGVRNNRQD